jgi:hypothetical protein
MLAQSSIIVPDQGCRIRAALAHAEFDLRCHHSATRMKSRAEGLKGLWKGSYGVIFATRKCVIILLSQPSRKRL